MICYRPFSLYSRDAGKGLYGEIISSSYKVSEIIFIAPYSRETEWGFLIEQT